ncbi:Retrograde transport protein Dsl1 N terminal [Nakaseomyces glabratus]|nr:Retrograde transport protein Dsl1 N terminal [Nakaseomyces glabratus]KAH7585394.1 Retrograde transport protein Dsl1 N terminal [Nakaseomyces glabratus]
MTYADKDHVITELLKDPVYLSRHNSLATHPKDENDLYALETKLEEELHDLKDLKIVSSLVKETQVNLDLMELENCYYSLYNLSKKLKSSRSFLKQSLHFQRSVAVHADELRIKLLSTIYDILATKFWSISESSFEFHPDIKWKEEEFMMKYEEFKSFVSKSFFPDNAINNSHWLITDIIHSEEQERMRNKLKDIYINYIDFASLTKAVKDALFSDEYEFEWSDNNYTKLLITKRGALCIQKRIESFNNLLSFLEKGISNSDKFKLLTNLGKAIGIEFLRFVKSNATGIIDKNANSIKQQTLLLNDRLKTISEQSGAWNFDSDQISKLLNDEILYKSLLLDGVLGRAISDVRKLIANESWKSKTKITLKNSEMLNDSKEKEISQDNVGDEWEWNEDEMDDDVHNSTSKVPNSKSEDLNDDEDGWADEIDVDLEDEINTKETEPEDDAWNDEWDVEEDIKSTHSNKNSKSKHVINTTEEVTITELPKKFLNIMEKLLEDARAIDVNLPLTEDFKYKANLLQTVFFSISSTKYGNEWWQFYNDMKFTFDQNNDMKRLQELIYNYMETNLQNTKKISKRILNSQLQQFQRNENNPSWNDTLDNFLPFLEEELANITTHITQEDSFKYITRLFSFIFEDVIIQNILSWDIISEKNSENISELLKLIITSTQIDSLNTYPKYRELYERVNIVAKLLPLHLKEIMEMFYNGDFYLFTTEEIITWIKLLFAETPLRKDAIDDIYEIRNTPTED